MMEKILPMNFEDQRMATPFSTCSNSEHSEKNNFLEEKIANIPAQNSPRRS